MRGRRRAALKLLAAVRGLNAPGVDGAEWVAVGSKVVVSPARGRAGATLSRAGAARGGAEAARGRAGA